VNDADAQRTPVAERVRAILDGLPLHRGGTIHISADGVAVHISPLPAGEAADGADHELTVSTGCPPVDPAIRGIPVRVSRLGPGGWSDARLGETDEYGSLLFSPGSDVEEYRLAVTEDATRDMNDRSPK
jgi:hypothetical protein